MKLVLLLCAVALVLAEEKPSSGKAIGYHEKFGIPQAQKIRQREAVSSRVLGGLPSFSGEDPYLAGLIIDLTNGETSVCAGALLNRRKVLTAAQCWYDGYLQGKKITAVLGSTTLFYGGKRQYVYSIIAHPQFNPFKLVNDLAMLTIPGVSYNMYINPVSLPVYQQNTSFVGETVRTVGYGITIDGGNISEYAVSNGVYVPVITNLECDDAYTSHIDNNTICTNGANKWGPCNGDGGAPLIYSSYPGENMLIGVYSFHTTAGCSSGFPFGYMRVTAYLPWIQNLLY